MSPRLKISVKVYTLSLEEWKDWPREFPVGCLPLLLIGFDEMSELRSAKDMFFFILCSVVLFSLTKQGGCLCSGWISH